MVDTRKLMPALCGLTVIFVSTVAVHSDVIVQDLDQDLGTGEDVLIAYGSVDGNLGQFGAASGIYIYEERAESYQNVWGRDLIKFPLPTLPAGATINSATLKLKLNQNPRNQLVNISLNRMLVPWEEMQATWDIAMTGVPWSTPGMASGVEYEAAVQDTVLVDNTPNVFFDWDITSAVTAWYTGAAPNYGLAILGENPTPGDAVIVFYSTESFQSFDPDTEPQLVIDYTVGGLVGDLNGDGFVGLDDLDIVLQNWNQSVPPADNRADPSGDGFVGLDDLDTVLNHWNEGTPPGSGAVPEPTTLGLLAPGVAVSACRRRRGR